MALKKPSHTPTDPFASLPRFDDPTMEVDLPNLYSFLRDDKYEDGSLRVTGSLTVFVKNGVLTVAINDNDNKRVTYINARTWAEAIFYANEAICSDGTEWKTKVPSQYQQKTPF